MKKILANLTVAIGFASMPTIVAAQQGSPPATGAVSIQIDNDQVKLQIYDLPPDIVSSVAMRLQLDYSTSPRVKVTTDPNTGKLMVMAPASVQAQISQKMQQLREEAARLGLNRSGGVRPESYTQNSYHLRNLTWREFEDSLKLLTGPRMTVNTERNGELAQFRLATTTGLQDVLQVDRRLNQVNLQGTAASVAGWLQVIGAMDTVTNDANLDTQIVPMAPAEPARIQRAIQLVRFAAQQQDEEEIAAVNVANPQLGNNQALGQDAQANEDERASAIGSIESGIDTESGLFGDVQIEFVSELGLVIIKGNKRDVQRVLEVIEQIKKQSVETQPEITVYPLKHADSTALATLVRELYTQVLAPRQGTVSITALGQPNSLLLIGRKEAIAGLNELLAKLDQPLDPSSQLRVFRLLNASAVDAETTVRGFFVERPGSEETPRTALGVRVKVSADYRTNSLIVQASPRDMEEVQKLIDSIDVESTEAQNEMRVFRLKNAIAEELEPVLQAAISGQAQQGGNQGQGGGATTGRATPVSTKLSIISPDGNGSTIDSGILAGVVITANAANNTLIVRAPAKSMPLIEALLKELDQLPGTEASIKVFTIKNGDATSLATVVQQLFGLPATAGTGTGGLFGLANQQNNAGLTAGGEGSLVPLRVSVDTRTNSIIASGSASDLEVIEVLLLRLDLEGKQDRITEVLWLRNAAAEDVSTALNQYLTTQRQIVQQTLLFNQAITRTEQFDREIIIVPEAATNSLIISVAPKYYDMVRSVIESLDRRPPMVMVQVLIAEVTLTDQFEWGSELGLQDSLLFDRSVVAGGTQTPGFNFNNAALGNSSSATSLAGRNNVAGQGLTSFGLGRASTLGYGGLVLSAASDSVSVLLRTLQDAGRLQILSRPQIMTLDSQPARILVGQSVPRVTSVNNSGTLGFTTSTEDEDVGLIMDITPRVNQDGLIVMNVAVERSAVGDSATGIPIAVAQDGTVIRSPIINRTQADTVISAYDNQTVVFAGLITKSRESITRRVPLISNIPILGMLFRFDSEIERRTELLVVMTPKIVKADEDYTIIKEVESSRMSWCLADILEMHGDVGLNGGHGLWGPASSPVIYPDMQPTVTGEESYPMIEGEPTPAMPADGASMRIQPSSPGTPVIQPAPVDPSGYYGDAGGVQAAGAYMPVAPSGYPNQNR